MQISALCSCPAKLNVRQEKTYLDLGATLKVLIIDSSQTEWVFRGPLAEFVEIAVGEWLGELTRASHIIIKV